MSLHSILSNILYLPLLFSLFLGLLKFKKLTKPLRLVFLFVVFGFLTEIALDVLKEFGMRNTMPVGNIYFPISFLILGLFYFSILKNFINKKLLVGIIVAFELFCIINLFFIQNLSEFPNITAAIGALIIIVFSVLKFSKVMSDAKIEYLSKEPVVWINTAFLIYYSANFFFYILFNLNVKLSPEFARGIGHFYVGVIILLYTIISIGFLKVGPAHKLAR